MLDYYGSGLKAFDKDREQNFQVRYVLSTVESTTTATFPGYVFTDNSGNEIAATAMQKDIDITSLTQYLYIDNTQTSIVGVNAQGGAS